MGKKKFMRGFFAYVLLVVFAAGVIFVTYGAIKDGIDCNEIVGLVLGILYIAAFFILPKIIKPVVLGPGVPEDNKALGTPATLTIVRDPNVAGAVVPTGIFLNGEQVCLIKNGESETIPLTMKKNILVINVVIPNYSIGGKVPNVRCEFEAEDGAKGEIHLKAGIFQSDAPKWN